jgi:hypothetical protein
LERVTDYWVYMPSFLPLAAREGDPLTRFKLVMGFGLGGLINTCKQKKPFNPILGETFEAAFEDGTSVFLEQSSHHPPITMFEVAGPGGAFRYFGYIHFTSSFGGNTIKGRWSGLCCVEFKDGTRIEWEMPPCSIRGIMWGTRRFQYIEHMTFRDAKNGLECTVQFNPDQKGFMRSLFSRGPKPRGDTIRGEILRGAPGVVGVTSAQPLAFKKALPSGVQAVAKLEGSWITHVEVDKVKLWSATDRQHQVFPVTDPLPSDSRFRDDLVALLNDDLEAARDFKIVMEEKQRFDAKLRQAGTKAREKDDKRAKKEK